MNESSTRFNCAYRLGMNAQARATAAVAGRPMNGASVNSPVIYHRAMVAARTTGFIPTDTAQTDCYLLPEAYITDTIARPDASYVTKIAGVDVLLHDCYAPDHFAAQADFIGHSHLTAVAQVAAKAQVKRLILIHHSTLDILNYTADLAHARHIFPMIEVGYDGMEIDF